MQQVVRLPPGDAQYAKKGITSLLNVYALLCLCPYFQFALCQLLFPCGYVLLVQRCEYAWRC